MENKEKQEGKIETSTPQKKDVKAREKLTDEEMKKKYAMMALSAFSLAEDQGLPRDQMFDKNSKVKN